MLLNVENISKTYGDRSLLSNITFYMKEGDRIGVVGINGCGKSTLLKVASGQETADSGKVSTDPNVRIGYLAQNPPFEPEISILEQVYKGLDTSARELAQYEAIEILTKLGIQDYTQQMKYLSGGQRKRIALASCLVHPADLLILDEPTNHLDAEMITWLEDYLQHFNGGILLVTHDRYFLESVTTRTAELSFGSLYFYDGGYSSYLNGKARREEMQAASERKRQSILRRELIWVLQGPCARGTKSKERLERYASLKSQQPPEFQTSVSEIQAISSRLGKKTVELTDVVKAFDGKTVIDKANLILRRDDRIGIVGKNGSGKSTILNLISGYILPDSGTVSVGDTVKLGYFSQHAAEMNNNITALDYVKEFGDHIETPDGYLSASKLMEKFLFSGPMQHRLIGKLSGGEKRRLFLLGILASAPNILLLDEPTNDLDIPTLTALEEYLIGFPGAIIAVSHDRYFLDRICHRIFAVEPTGKVTLYPGGYTDWLTQQATTSSEKKKQGKSATSLPSSQKSQKLKFTFNEKREFETIDDDIADLEKRIQENKRLQNEHSSDYLKLQELMNTETSLKSALEQKTERWLYLTELAEKIALQ